MTCSSLKSSPSVNRVLVTGGAGFIGSHTVDLLLREGKQVIVLDNLFSGKLVNLNLHHPNLEFIKGDILEYSLVKEHLTRCDAILHLAAIPSVPYSIEKPIYSSQVNTQGFLHILQAVHESSATMRLVYASSSAVYGPADELPCSDEVALSGDVLSPYALQKIHVENYATLYATIHGVKSLGLRYFNVYGNRQDPDSSYSGVIARFLNAYKNETALTIFGDGQQSRDFIYVSDVARANVLALCSDCTGVLNIATEKSHSLLQLVELIEAVRKKPAKINFLPARLGEIHSSCGAVKSAQHQLGFSYEISLREGVQRMLGEESLIKSPSTKVTEKDFR
jgi:UDP-glucose 4-epimerase